MGFQKGGELQMLEQSQAMKPKVAPLDVATKTREWPSSHGFSEAMGMQAWLQQVEEEKSSEERGP